VRRLQAARRCYIWLFRLPGACSGAVVAVAVAGAPELITQPATQ